MEEMKFSEILKMKTDSEEFFEAYKAISDKYWCFENPDDLQMAAKTLVMWAERYDTDKVILCHKIIEAIMNLGKSSSARGHVVFSDKEYYFDIYENENSKDTLDNMLKKAQDGLESGKIKVNKSKFGKNYFKDK